MPKQLVVIVNPEHRWPMLKSRVPFLGGDLTVIPIEDSSSYRQELAGHPERLLIFNLAPHSDQAQMVIHNVEIEAAGEHVPYRTFPIVDGVRSVAGEMLLEIVLDHKVPAPLLTA